MTSVERGLQTARKVVTFGEIMLRLSPPGLERFLTSPTLSATFGGGEANVAVSLAHFGLRERLRDGAPDARDRRGRRSRAPSRGRAHRSIVRRGSRVGIYFAETGASQRASTVIYDRAHSAISELTPDAVDWSAVLSGAAWFHVTGITPALGTERGRGHRARHPRGPRGGCARQLRSELSPKTLDRGRGAACRRPAAEERRSRRRQRGGPAVRARHPRRQTPTSRPGIWTSTDSATRPSA